MKTNHLVRFIIVATALLLHSGLVAHARLPFKPLGPVTTNDVDGDALASMFDAVRAGAAAIPPGSNAPLQRRMLAIELDNELESFLTSRTNSTWETGVRLFLARHAQQRSSYALAIEHYRRAFNIARNSDAPGAWRTLREASGGLARLLALTGRLQEFDSFEDEARQAGVVVSSSNWRWAKEMRDWARKHPADAYKCGLYCLDQLGRLTQSGAFRPKAITETPSSVEGFTVAELLQVANRVGLSVHAAILSDFNNLPVPCIVHLRSEHFVVVRERRGSFYEVYDTVALGSRWLTAGEIAQEASGCLIVSDAVGHSVGDSLSPISPQAAVSYRGRCHGPLPYDHDDSPCETCPCPPGRAGSGGASGWHGHSTDAGGSPGRMGLGGGGSSSCAGCTPDTMRIGIGGMPVWFVSEPYLSLWFQDVPLRYQPAFGPEVVLKLAYTDRNYVSDISGSLWQGVQLGNDGGDEGRWGCSWRSYAELSDDENKVELMLPLGGWATFTFPVSSSSSDRNYRHNLWLEKITAGGNITALQLHRPDGSTAKYGARFDGYDPVFRVFYLTESADATGQKTTFTYDTSYADVQYLFALTNVTAADGTSFTLNLNDIVYRPLVTNITASYGASVSFDYGGYNLLEEITDAAGITSQFTYENGPGYGGAVTNLITPYGTTWFSTRGANFDQGIFDRTVRIGNALGQQEFYAQLNTYSGSDWPDFASSQIPTNTPVNTLDTTERQERNTFHWNVAQFAPYTGTSLYDFNWAAFNRARIRHWLANTDPNYTHFDTLSIEQEPSPDGTTNTQGQLTWYDYVGKPANANYEIGTQILPAVVARVMPDGSTAYTYNRYNTLGNLTNRVEKWADGNTAHYRTNVFIYDATGVDLVAWTNAAGVRAATNIYNAYHQVVTNFDALNQETTYTYDGTTRQLLTITRPSGLVTSNYYDGTGRLRATTDLPIDRSESYTWRTDGNLDSVTDARGLTVTNFWDGLNRLTGRRYPDGTTTSNRFTISTAYPNGSGGLTLLDTTATKDRLGHWNYFGYDALRRLIAVTNANNAVTRYGYCDCGAVAYMTNGWSSSAELWQWYEFDNQGRRIYTHHPDATVTNWYDSLGRTITTCDAWGCRWFGYDNLNRLTSITNAFGAEQVQGYDLEDQVVWAMDANGVTITNTYDDLGRLRTRTYPDSGVESFGYSARGLIAYTNQLGFTNFYAYDEAGRKIFETNANWELIRYTNNAAGDLLALVDGKQQVTKWNYDEYGRVTNKLDQAGTVILKYTYDADSRLSNRWSVAKGTTIYSYDPVGNLTNINYPASTDVAFAYDALNRVTNMVDAAGTTAYAYAAGGQLWTEDGPWSSDTVTNFYWNRMRTNLSLAQPTGKWTNGFAYDAAKRLTNVTSPAGAFDYTLGGGSAASALIKKLTLPNTSYITNAYDTVARLRFTKLNNSSHTTLDSADYGYNVGNQRTTFTNAAGTYVQYTNDNIGQLKIANSSVNTEDRGYVYDAAWNLNYRTNNTILQTFSVDHKNQLTNTTLLSLTKQTYDANGNLTFVRTSSHSSQGYSYDDENRLENFYFYDDKNGGDGSPTGPDDLRTEFIYDGTGRLRNRREYTTDGTSWILAAETHYLYDGMRVIQERDGSNVPTVSYTRGTDLSGSLEGAGGIGGLLGRSHAYQTGSGNWTNHNFYHADGNGNITYLVNSSQTVAASYRYDPFGNTLSSSGSLAGDNVYRFSSKEVHVNSGMYYYGYRFYDPPTQRWLNCDPIGEIGFEAVRSPGRSIAGIASNRYYFIANDPINNADALGLKLYKCVRQAKTMPYNLHAYLWDDKRKQSCGRTGSGYLNNPKDIPRGEDAGGDKGPGNPGHTCVEIPGGEGREDSVMSCCMRKDPRSVFFPVFNDCHNWVDCCLNKNGLDDPPLNRMNDRFWNVMEEFSRNRHLKF